MAHASSPDTTTRPSLPLELRAATRENHHALNTLIATRLLLCLSPHADNPLIYAKGMAAFGQVYFAFEDFLTASLASGDQDPRFQEIYNTLHLPQLIRTSRLQQDIETIKSRLEGSAAEEVNLLEHESKAFYSRIQGLLSARPHVLLGYAWAMYLALFNGGRWIRRQLVSQGPGFWHGPPIPLSFWEFDGDATADSEGEHLKVLFQERLLAAASLLRDDEKDDVIKETTRLFELCSEIVHFLDNKLDTTPRSQPDTADSRLRGSFGELSPVTAAWQYLTSSYESLKTVTAWAWNTKQPSWPKA
ncbi:hypothetical protein A1O3_05106 [Capronia epimyces CBS 606.96]|uniref:Heme oxygenase n=1 Tax=Capronia epimyces CBS 606.96 TaxID=1182542 RepID=W9XW44_9EURO|nr:uncharacterized protein A1O3_05106 [Capronia epimyces CBS 606.96]EXJ84438.1 hypothetical protein A1O3_05106 [Capronia epimyces CBS 606.96]